MFFKKRNKKIYDDSEMIRLAKRNAKDFELIYNAYFDFVFRFVYARLGGDEAESADITQQTFIKAMAAISNYEDRGHKLSTWLIRIAQNEVNMFFRKQKKIVEVDIEAKQLGLLIQEIEEEDDSQERLGKLIDSINALPTDKQDLIELRFFSGFSFKEIADIYNISEANAKMRIYRILENIKSAVKS